MKREFGNMWTIFDHTDNFIITTNSYIRADGALVMGRGIAAEVKARYPHVPHELGAMINHLSLYGLVTLMTKQGLPTISAFQVKYHYSDPATLELIQYSTTYLDTLASEIPECRFDMNFPGIGNGKLAYDDVLPIVQQLPDNVHIWTFH